MITLLATGGTIASVAGPGGRDVGVPGEQLLQRARTVWDIPQQVHTENVHGLISSALRTEDLLDLARRVRQAATPVVITHGTDALEETALAIALTRRPDDPAVVLTGAQRPFDDPAGDGPRNLAAALSWAASPLARGSGVTVVFADHVLPAVGVRKVHTLALNGFAAPGRGPLATIDDAGIRQFARPVLPEPLLAQDAATLAPVAVLPSYVGMSTTIVDQIRMEGYAGVVVDAMGAGNMPPLVTAKLAELSRDGIAVAICSRTGAGATSGLYAGGGADLVAAGGLAAGDLSSAQVRLVLGAALTTSDWRSAILRWLEECGAIAAGSSLLERDAPMAPVQRNGRTQAQ